MPSPQLCHYFLASPARKPRLQQAPALVGAFPRIGVIQGGQSQGRGTLAGCRAQERALTLPSEAFLGEVTLVLHLPGQDGIDPPGEGVAQTQAGDKEEPGVWRRARGPGAQVEQPGGRGCGQAPGITLTQLPLGPVEKVAVGRRALAWCLCQRPRGWAGPGVMVTVVLHRGCRLWPWRCRSSLVAVVVGTIWLTVVVLLVGWQVVGTGVAAWQTAGAAVTGGGAVGQPTWLQVPRRGCPDFH